MRRLLFVADLHLVPDLSPLHRAVFVWLAELVRSERIDTVIAGGDMVQRESAEASAVLARELVTRLPVERWVWLPGNRDPLIDPRVFTAGMPALRTSHCVVTDVHVVQAPGGTLVFASSESSAAALRALDSAGARGEFSSGAVCVFTHRDVGVRERVARLIARPRRADTDAGPANGVRIYVAGHSHYAADSLDAGWRIVRSAGLDHTRTRACPPDAILVDAEHESIIVRRVIPPNRYLQPEPCRIVDTGIAPRAPVGESLERAAAEGIGAVQLAAASVHGALGAAAAEAAAARWRATVEPTTLSVHLPSVMPDASDGLGGMRRYIEAGERFGVVDYTAHLPETEAEAFFTGSRDALTSSGRRWVELYAAIADAVRQSGARMNLENLHNAPEHLGGRMPDKLSSRPWHLARAVEEIRRVLGDPDPVGIILDLGHARNNGAVSTEIAPSEWISVLASDIRALHVHQVRKSASGMVNHMSLVADEPGLINYRGIAALLRSTPGPDCTAYVEVRQIGDAVLSWRVLRGLFGA